MRSRRGFALGYVKVEIRSRSPRLWGWGLHRDGGDNLLRRSDAAYGCAEDPWKADQSALASLEAAALLSPAIARQEEVAA